MISKLGGQSIFYICLGVHICTENTNSTNNEFVSEMGHERGQKQEKASTQREKRAY